MGKNLMIARYHVISKMDICLDRQKKYEFTEKYIYKEIIYRQYSKRTAFKRMMNEIGENDLIVVESLDLLGNSIKDLLKKLCIILNNKVHIKIENIQINTKDDIVFGDFIIFVSDANKNKMKQLEQEEKDIQEFYDRFHSRKIMDMNYIKLEEDLYRYLDGKTTINNLANKYGVSESYLYNHVKKLEH